MGPSDALTTILQKRPALMGRFQVMDVIGEGAGSVVYRVLDRERGNQIVALKVLTDTEAFDEHTLARFYEELKVLQRLRHPNLIEAYDLIEHGSQVAYTMEFVSGCDLAQILKDKRLTPAEIDALFSQILDGLAELHGHGIIHRDLKLENILLREDGSVKISDLGLMKKQNSKGLTQAGVLLGTAPYMPPEYIRHGKLDERGDLYAVGVMLHELLSGERRMANVQGTQAIQHLLETKFQLPMEEIKWAPKKYISILEKALAVDPKARFQSAAEMRAYIRGTVQPTDKRKKILAPLVWCILSAIVIGILCLTLFW